MQQVVFASSNPGKLREVEWIAGGVLHILPQSRFNIPAPSEEGLSFVENALIKARSVAHYTDLPAMADDSGLEVDALGGAPGVYSARYAGSGASDEDNIERLLRDLEGVPEGSRRARFHCLVVYMRQALDPTPIICQGIWEGHILLRPQGENGFGYDPVFYVPEYGCSAAELPTALKNYLSHRARAFTKLLDCLRKTPL